MQFLYATQDGFEFIILQPQPLEQLELEAGATMPAFISMLEREVMPNSTDVNTVCLWVANLRGKTGNIILQKVIKFQNIKKFLELQNQIKQTPGPSLRYSNPANS